jgi:hypothetical protein
MSEYSFGFGPGWLDDSASEIAKRHGAILVNYADLQCACGQGCPPGECVASRRHWFTVPNRGNPFDGQTRAAVLADLVGRAR